MNADQIADRVHARRSAVGWIARCPAHEDRSPSLSIRAGEGGRVLLHCFSGCGITAICDAMHLKVCDLFPGPSAGQPKQRAVREAEVQIVDLRSRLTPRERVLPVTVVECNLEYLNPGIARALALSVEGDIVQVVLEPVR